MTMDARDGWGKATDEIESVSVSASESTPGVLAALPLQGRQGHTVILQQCLGARRAWGLLLLHCGWESDSRRMCDCSAVFGSPFCAFFLFFVGARPLASSRAQTSVSLSLCFFADRGLR